MAANGDLGLSVQTRLRQGPDAGLATTLGEDAPMKREDLAEYQKPQVAKLWYSSRFF